MHRIETALCAAVLAVCAGCGGGTFADVSGSVAGSKFSAQSWYWGGPYIVFVDQAWDCMDMYWVQRGPTFNNGGDAPTDKDMRALLFTYVAAGVVAGDYDLEGEAPVDARVLDVVDGALTVYEATTGNLVVDDVKDKGQAAGNFSLGFDDGSLEGDFRVDWCNNMKSKD